MRVQVFAMLKEYFSEDILVDSTQVRNAEELILALSSLNPQAAPILKRCRIAVDLEFVSGSHKLKEHDTISIIPPSSGG